MCRFPQYSKALHDSPEISPKTIERVKELAALHNYRPNPVAVNLKSSKSGTIGVIVPNIENSFFAKVLSGIEAQARKGRSAGDRLPLLDKF